MKLAYSSNAYMAFSVFEAIERIAAVGYSGIELMADVPHCWPASITDEDVTAIRRALEAHSLSISNVNAFMMNAVQDFWHPSWIEPDPAYRRLRVEHTKSALAMARKLGAPSITTQPGGPMLSGMSREWALDVFVEGLQEVLPHAEREGVLLLVEPEPDLLIEDSAQFLELAGRIDSPAFGLNFDVGHMFCVSEPLTQAVATLQPHTRHYHIEDIAPSRVHRHLIPGEGAIDFAKVINAIRDAHYDGWLTVELYPYVQDPDGAGRAALEHLRPLL